MIALLLGMFVFQSVGRSVGRSVGHSLPLVRFGLLLRCVDKRIVNIVNV